MIERHYGQRQIAEGFFNEPIADWWEPWMKHADEILDDEELINIVYEALQRRHPQSATRGRMGTPAEIVIRLMVLKHVRGWSYETLEREVRANMVYRMFTRIGAEKVSDAKTMGRLGKRSGLKWLKRFPNAWWESPMIPPIISTSSNIWTIRGMRIETEFAGKREAQFRARRS